MRRLLVAVILIAGLYIAYPYLTLYWLDRALLTADTGALQTLIDFPEVRHELKAEIKLALIEKAQTQAGEGKLLGIFGAALTALLVPTMVDSVVDDMVTPEKLVNNDEVVKRRQEGKSFIDFVIYAFFRSPTQFRVDLRDPDDKDSPTLTTLMELTGGRWRVVALELPPIETWLTSKDAAPSEDAVPAPQ